MKRQRSHTLYVILAIALLISLACNAPFMTGATQQPTPTAVENTAPTTNNSQPIAAASTPTPLPINHQAMPADVSPSGAYNYDVDSSGTGPEHRAPYGDSYDINLFERPFTQTDMTYLPELDIVNFRMTQDETWTYVFIDLVGGDMNNTIGINYGVELDTDHDGFGDVLVWAHPQYTTTWTTDVVAVYTDTNHDTGGLSADKSDAPLDGNGYDKVIFNAGQGNDPDLAWVRLDPHQTDTVDFAFKNILAGSAFMWGVWADAGLKDPSKFNYNDRFTEEEAGSPVKDKKYYPIKAIYQVDNTCWAAVGFKPNGYEPHLCPPLQPGPTKQPHQHNATPTPFKFFNICAINPTICQLPPPPVP